MPLTFLLDEHLRGLRQAIIRHNRRGLGLSIDAVCVGDFDDLLPGSPDSDLLVWAKRENRVVVTLDQGTMPDHLTKVLRLGHHSPGVLIIDDSRSWRTIIEYLELVAHAGTTDDFRDAVHFGP